MTVVGRNAAAGLEGVRLASGVTKGNPMDQERQASHEAIDLLKTARGQVDASLRIVEEDRNCVEVSQQVRASIALLKKANLVILKRHMTECLKGAGGRSAPEKIQQVTLILKRYLER